MFFFEMQPLKPSAPPFLFILYHVGLTQNITCFKGSQVKDPISSWDVSWNFCVGFLEGENHGKNPGDVMVGWGGDEGVLGRLGCLELWMIWHVGMIDVDDDDDDDYDDD